METTTWGHAPSPEANRPGELPHSRALDWSLPRLEHPPPTNDAHVESLHHKHRMLAAELAEVNARLALLSCPSAVLKPFHDILPSLAPFKGDGPLEEFLERFSTLADVARLTPEVRVFQLIQKFQGKAQDWFHHHFVGRTDAVTLAELRLGLRNTFGREYAAGQAVLDIYRNPMDFGKSGTDRLQQLGQLEDKARQLGVSVHPGPAETQFYKLLLCLSPSEQRYFFSELNANSLCSDAALRALEESSDPTSAATGSGPSRASLSQPPTRAREDLFSLRVTLATAAIKRIPTRTHPSGHSGAAQSARIHFVDGGNPFHPVPAPGPIGMLSPAPSPLFALHPPRGLGPAGTLSAPRLGPRAARQPDGYHSRAFSGVQDPHLRTDSC